LPSGQALGYQQMRVGSAHADSTLENAMSMCTSFGRPFLADQRREF
jgi:serine/threonine-protein kinase HipA